MSLTVSAETGSSKTFDPAPSGTHRAACVGIYDLGTQTKVYADGPQTKPAVLFVFEIVDEKMDDGRPFTLSREFNISLHENSSLRPFLEAWRGRPFTDAELKRFDISGVLGAPGLASVIHKEGKDKMGRPKVFANITGISRLPKGMAAPEGTENDLRRYEIESREVPDWMPKWVAAKVRSSAEYQSGGFRDSLAEVETKDNGNGSTPAPSASVESKPIDEESCAI